MKYTPNGFESSTLILDNKDIEILYGGHTLSHPGLNIRLDLGTVIGDATPKSLCPQPVSYEKKERLIILSCKCGERAGLTEDIWHPNLTCIECGYAVHKEIVKE